MARPCEKAQFARLIINLWRVLKRLLFFIVSFPFKVRHHFQFDVSYAAAVLLNIPKGDEEGAIRQADNGRFTERKVLPLRVFYGRTLLGWRRRVPNNLVRFNTKIGISRVDDRQPYTHLTVLALVIDK